MHNSYKYAGCVLGGVLSLQAAELFAQERRSVGLEEIIVTAQKREESLTDVPMSVSALSAETMENRQLNSLADLANSVRVFKTLCQPTSFHKLM